MHILADENVHTDIIQNLRNENYKVLFAPEIGLSGKSDKEILDYAEKKDFILLTGDKDFGALIEFGTLWGKGKVILLRHHIIKPQYIAFEIMKVLNIEKKFFSKEIIYNCFIRRKIPDSYTLSRVYIIILKVFSPIF